LPGRFSQAEYDVMGGTVQRGSVGEVPGGRWVKLAGQGETLGFASDALYGFNLTPEGVLQATIVRATRYAADLPAQVDEHPWRAVLDVGELRFRFLLTPDTTALDRLSAELEQPPLVMHVIPSPGPGATSGGFMRLSPDSVRVLAIKPAEDRQCWIMRLQSVAGKTVVPEILWMGQALTLAPIRPRALATYRLQREANGKWQATPVDLLEQALK
jgi:alpha-mannosidase